MATMYIAEYERQARDAEGNMMQAGEEPATTTQAVTYTATSGESAAFLDSTTFVRISIDAAGFVLFGAAPTAVTLTHTPMAANVPEYWGVRPRTVAGLKVSAVI